MSKNNIDIYDIAPSIEDILKENQWLKIEIKELKVLNENLNKYIDNFRQNANIQYLHDNQQIYKLKQAIKVLIEKLELKLEVYRNGGCTLSHKVILNCITSDERCLRDLEIKEYELLKQVFESVGGE